ncbi:hypothetical protein [Sphingomonas sp.]|uniref:hypothetical protein n=1 Tax=Sphingomonas sp. TaxID=28214 RepID=UPI003B3B0CF7
MKQSFPLPLLLLLSSPALAQEQRQAPISDTEDAGLNLVDVGPGRLHPLVGLDLRNGDFVRGSYDDDAASLARAPVHVQIGLVYELARKADGDATTWLMLRSSNGLHAPSADERASPRAWYESNTLVGLASRLAPGMTGALTYTVKASPNGISATTHEISGSLALSRDHGLGALKPGLVISWRPKGAGGLYTQATIEPGWSLGQADTAPTLSLPLALGAGWRGFYEPGSGDRVYASGGIALQTPLPIGGGHWSARMEALAVVRDNRLRALGGPRAEHGTFQPYVTLALSYGL